MPSCRVVDASCSTGETKRGLLLGAWLQTPQSGVRRPGLRPSSAPHCAVTVSPSSCFFEPWVYDRVCLCAGTAKRDCSFVGPSPGSESVGLGQGPWCHTVLRELPNGAGLGISRAGHRPGLVTLQRPGMGLSRVETAPGVKAPQSGGLGSAWIWKSVTWRRGSRAQFSNFQVLGWAPAESLCQQSNGIPTRQ